MSEIFRLGELFCGPGGLALGAGIAKPQGSGRDRFSISHVWGVDKNSSAIDTYDTNIVGEYGGESFCEDANAFCKNCLPNCESITALAFGFPCNDFSRVGKMRGTDGDYGKLYQAGITVIEKENPKWFIAENVSGIHSANEGKAFKKILCALESAGAHGYNLTVNLYKFEEYGVPQYRHRYIIVGIRRDIDRVFRVPQRTHGEGMIPFQTAAEAISGVREDALNHMIPIHNHRVTERLKLTPPWHNAWFLDKLLAMGRQSRQAVLESMPWYDDEFEGQSDRRITARITDARLHCTKARMSHIYKRLDSTRPSYTITGSGGGGTHVYHWEEHRALTNRERARLQSFPDWFEFKGTKEEVRKQIGMAVPPEASKIIFEAILKTFAGASYPSQPASYSGDSV